jgi:hypothetical protein
LIENVTKNLFQKFFLLLQNLALQENRLDLLVATIADILSSEQKPMDTLGL